MLSWQLGSTLGVWGLPQEGCEWRGDRAEAMNEPPIKVDKAEEMLESLHHRRCEPLHHSGHLGFVYRHLMLTDNITQEQDFGNVKFTFLIFDRDGSPGDKTIPVSRGIHDSRLGD